MTAPTLLSNSVAHVNHGMPAFVYTIPDKGNPHRAPGAFSERFPLDQVVASPFMQSKRLFAPNFTAVTPESSVWGVRNQTVLGASDLADDYPRWREFRGSLLDHAGFSDHMRIFFTTATDDWLGLCGAFSTGARYTERSRRAMAALDGDLADVLRALRVLETSDARRDLFRRAEDATGPAFAYTTTGKFLFANAAAAVMEAPPQWLARALAKRSTTPRSWRVDALPYGNDEILLFSSDGGAPPDPFDRFLLNMYRLPVYLRGVALLVARGRTNRAIAAQTGLKLRVVNTYVQRVLTCAKAENRTEFVYKAAREALLPRSLWPLIQTSSGGDRPEPAP